MTQQRWHEVMDQDKNLTQDEIDRGWHFCLEFDGLLVGPGWGELECCRCLPHDHPVYITKPAASEEP